MKFYQVTDPEFVPYGRIIYGYDTTAICNTLKADTPIPVGVGYVPEQPELQELAVTKYLSSNLFGGMPVEMGWCNGHNTKLNCLEYHRSSEFNVGATDFILLLAKQDEIVAGKLDTSKVKAFYVPAGILVEVYATTLHYAPCSTTPEGGFQVLVLLPKGTNLDKPDISIRSYEDTLLTAANKWLLAHSESAEASGGAVVGLTGENIDIKDDLAALL